jgi:CcmD family protein
MTMRHVRDTLGRSAALAALVAALAAAPSTLAALAAAQQPAAQRPAEQRPPEPPAGFVPADSLPQQEQLPAAPLVITAYAVAWVLVFGYLWTIWQRLGRVERELAEVRRRVDAGARP